MKKKYEGIKLNICLLDFQDIVTASVYIEWDDSWQNEDSSGVYIFG